VASVSVPNSAGSVASLTLAAGNYVVWAKAWFQNAGIGSGVVTCTLNAGAKLDEARLTLSSGAAGTGSLVGVTSPASSTSVTVQCADGGGVVDATASDVRIVAVKVEALTGS